MRGGILGQIVYDMPAEDYFANPAFGSTSIKLLSDPDISLAEVKHLLEHDEHKKEYDVGTLAHALILEGTLDHLVAPLPFPDYRTKEAREARDLAYSAGMIPVNESEQETMMGPIEAMRDAVFDHPIAAELFTGHQPEVSLFWEQDGVGMKARVDALHQSRGIMADLKTVRSARPNDFRKQISGLGYYIQGTHYRNGGKAVTGFEMDWYFVAAQKTEPYTVSVHKLSQAALDHGQRRIEYAIRRYKQTQETGWTGYTAVYEQDLTPWEAIKNDELLEEIT